METSTQVSLLLLNLVFGFFIFLFTARWLVRMLGVSGFNPMTTFIAKATNPVTAPLSRILPDMGAFDTAALVIAVLLKALALYWMMQLLDAQTLSYLGLGILALSHVMGLVVDILFWSVIIGVVLSWIAPDSRSPGAFVIREITAPFLSIFQRILPPMGGLDLSPIVALFVLKLIEILILAPIAALSVQV
jgi:YggT family protein